jgi:hypothetical protein
MTISEITTGIAYVYAAIPNNFTISSIDSLSNTISLSPVLASSLVNLTQDSIVEIVPSPSLVAIVYNTNDTNI